MASLPGRGRDDLIIQDRLKAGLLHQETAVMQAMKRKTRVDEDDDVFARDSETRKRARREEKARGWPWKIVLPPPTPFYRGQVERDEGDSSQRDMKIRKNQTGITTSTSRLNDLSLGNGQERHREMVPVKPIVAPISKIALRTGNMDLDETAIQKIKQTAELEAKQNPVTSTPLTTLNRDKAALLRTVMTSCNTITCAGDVLEVHQAGLEHASKNTTTTPKCTTPAADNADDGKRVLVTPATRSTPVPAKKVRTIKVITRKPKQTSSGAKESAQPPSATRANKPAEQKKGKVQATSRIPNTPVATKTKAGIKGSTKSNIEFSSDSSDDEPLSQKRARMYAEITMEEWELKEGRVRGNVNQGDDDDDTQAQENIAFSSKYITSRQPTGVKISNVHFQVIHMHPRSTNHHIFNAENRMLRVCSVAAGKVHVTLGKQEFKIGVNGMWRVRKGESCRVVNVTAGAGEGATVHVSGVE